MSEKKYEINGGFPPIKYCKKTKENKNRSFASTINIKKILYTPTNNKLINIASVDDEIEAVDVL
jgi:hypothetical protein